MLAGNANGALHFGRSAFACELFEQAIEALLR